MHNENIELIIGGNPEMTLYKLSTHISFILGTSPTKKTINNNTRFIIIIFLYFFV